MMNIREQNGMFVCQDCSYVYSSMLGDDEIPENCDQCYVYDRDCDDCGAKTCAEVAYFYEDKTFCEDCCPDGYGE
tara:strand:- start:1336 stop:1560 length:225 start_codon:yes stop_codon:yes gene_type:complete